MNLSKQCDFIRIATFCINFYSISTVQNFHLKMSFTIRRTILHGLLKSN